MALYTTHAKGSSGGTGISVQKKQLKKYCYIFADFLFVVSNRHSRKKTKK